jgi:hypothetical protein
MADELAGQYVERKEEPNLGHGNELTAANASTDEPEKADSFSASEKENNSAPADAEQGAVSVADAEQEAVSADAEQGAVSVADAEQEAVSADAEREAAPAWKDALGHLITAAGKGAPHGTLNSVADLSYQVVDLTNQVRQQNADIRLKDADIRLKDAEQQLEKAKWEAEVQAERAKREAEVQAERAKWEAEVQAERAKREAERAEWEAEVQAETTADKFRSIVLVFVILAVVATPIFAMARKVDPTSFLQYVAPITAIAGTVLGYWFGNQDRDQKRRVNPKG